MTEMQLKLSAKGLPNLDGPGSGTSDPFAKVFTYRNESWILAGKTEVANENVNPVWEKTITADLKDDGEQYLKVEVWEEDGDVGKADLIGTALISVRALVDSQGIKTLPLSGQGTITVQTA